MAYLFGRCLFKKKKENKEDRTQSNWLADIGIVEYDNRLKYRTVKRVMTNRCLIVSNHI